MTVPFSKTDKVESELLLHRILFGLLSLCKKVLFPGSFCGPANLLFIHVHGSQLIYLFCSPLFVFLASTT